MPLTANAAFTERHLLESIIIANPAAASSVMYTVPDNNTIQVVGLRFLFTTDANVADRRVGVHCYQDVGTGFVQASIPPIVQTASLAYLYYVSCGVAPVDASGDVNPFVCFPLACGIQLQAGEQLHIVSASMQAADQLSGICMRYYGWKED